MMINNLPPGWASAAVSQVGSVRLGRQRSHRTQTGRFPTPYLRAANITPTGLDLSEVLTMDFTPAERESFRLVPGDIVLAEASGSATQVGRPAVWRGELPLCCYQNHLIRFRPHAAVPEFAAILFRHYAASGEFGRVARGIGILHLGAARFANMQFPVPPLAEQQKIAREVEDRLAELSSGGASLRSALRHVDEQDREILAAAVAGELVEPEASVAERERRPYEHARTLLRPEDEGDLQTDLFGVDASMLQSVEGPSPPPAGWMVTRVDQVGTVRLGRQRAPGKLSGRFTTPYLRAANITRNGLDLQEVYEMDFTSKERDVFALLPGDIVLAEASGSPAQVGRTAMWRGELPLCCYQNTVIRLRVHAVLPEYAQIVCRHYAMQGVFARASRGIGIQHLSASRFAALPFPFPPLAEQHRIVDEVQRRLDASWAERAAIDSSLSRLPSMEREVLAAAVAGRLVPQDAADESGPELLERLGPPPPVPESLDTTEPEENVVTPTIVHADGAAPRTEAPLAAILHEAGHAMTVTELFTMAGYNGDLPGQVEDFYLALRQEVDRTIRRADAARENALLEWLPDAS